jgi:hypothetical protein
MEQRLRQDNIRCFDFKHLAEPLREAMQIMPFYWREPPGCRSNSSVAGLLMCVKFQGGRLDRLDSQKHRLTTPMRKVTAKEFQHRFGKLSASLKPGQTLQVIRDGNVDGVYQKAPKRKIPFPDFKTWLKQHDYSEESGEALLRTLDGTLTLT